MATSLSADTRARILECAWDRVREGGAEAVRVKDIAAAAGVSRQLVYFHYGNRAGLLLEMARWRDHASGFRSAVAATRELPPEEALEALLHKWCDYLPELLPVARALEAALITGEEGGAALRDRLDDLHEAYRLAIDRVAEAGLLAAGWTVDMAADWVSSRVQPATYAYLVGERAWTHEQYAERTVSPVLAELLGR